MVKELVWYIKKFEKKEDTEEQYKEIVKELNDGIGCELNGQFQIDKVSGNFHLSFHNYMDHYRNLVYRDHDSFLKLNLSYKILDLSFGSSKQDQEDKKIFRLLKEMNLDDDILNNFVDHQEFVQDHFIAAHWLEIIPYTFVDNRDGYKYKSYLHSFNRKIKVFQKAY